LFLLRLKTFVFFLYFSFFIKKYILNAGESKKTNKSKKRRKEVKRK